MPVALASLIGGHWRTYILLLSEIGFNLSYVYALLYSAPAYEEIPILHTWVIE